MPVLLRDLIDLPENVRQGDFVLRLSEGVTKPDETLRNYVVTPQLAKCFEQALDLLKGAVQAKSSKGAYLHGSFGSGKSHFMAVLLLLLENNPQARSIPELAEAVAALDRWASGKKFLLVPYHMIGAKDLTSAVLGGYVDHISRIHPSASVPGVYRSDGLFANAQQFRRDLGDEAFFAKLNGEGSPSKSGATDDDGWGELSTGWDSASFEAALGAGPKDPRRARLVGDLVAHVFPAMRGMSEFVDIDQGLAIISRHASDLGYDGLILFLDELILWLASHAADSNFVAQEGQKLSKLVESQNADRPTPIVSFIARQRDLRELVGENMIGLQQVTFADSLKHWDQRFDVVRLDDRNLTIIAEKRVLRPKSEAARLQIDQAFRETEKIRQEVLSVLLTSHRNTTDFRAVYPFSPALVDTLVALSALLQRERTALKIMFQLLVEQRDTLHLGSVVPVGDLFDVIMRGDEPFSEVMRAHAENARRLYQEKILPLIESDLGITKAEVGELPAADARRAAFLRDTRLAKTILLAALAPEVESFKNLTVKRLAALNHGTIKTPIPGRESQVVHERVRKWAAEIGQIRIGEEQQDPTVTVQLTGVDTESILAQAASEDNDGNRVRLIKRMLFDKLGVEAADQLILEHRFTWRATKRVCEVLCTNVRVLNDESFRNDGENWKLIIDFPFDPDAHHTPRDDHARAMDFLSKNPKGARTLVWLPSFFSQAAKKDLGLLVVLEHVLTGARFDGYASRLTEVDRAQARGILDNQRSALRVRVQEYLSRAYGIGSDTGGILDTTHQLEREEQVLSLHPDVSVRPPAAANLSQAMSGLLDQALAGQFPGHPVFDAETNLGRATVARVWAELQKALSSPEGRTMVDSAQRKDVRAIVTALKLANMSEAHLVIDQHWRTHFERKIAAHGSSGITARHLRGWLNDPRPMGLPTALEDLILLTFGAQTNRVWVRFGSDTFEADIEKIPEDAELREQPLPEQPVWERAVERAQSVFGLAASQLRSAANVAKLNADLGQAYQTHLETMRELVRELQSRLGAFNVPVGASARLKTAQSVLVLLEGLRSAPDTRRVNILAEAAIDGTGITAGTALKQSQAVLRSLRDTHWRIVESAGRLQPAGPSLIERTQEILRLDELAKALAPALKDVVQDAAKLIEEAASSAAPRTAPSPAPVPAPLTPPEPGKAGGQGAPVGGDTAGSAGRTIEANPTVSTPAVRTTHEWAGSDDAEVAAFYSNQPEKYARNRRLAAELKQLYGASQIEGDEGPRSLPKDRLLEVLEVHLIVPLAAGGADGRENMIVLTPTLHALVHADPEARFDLARGTLRLFGREIRLTVLPNHRG